jgi:membrane associated rhomboid family serine protease
MPRNVSFEMGLPPFRGAVRQIIIFSTAVYIIILLSMAFEPRLGHTILELGALNPPDIAHGRVWQFVTYAFMYTDPLDFVLSLVGIYFIGASVEERIGFGNFYSLFFSSLILSALAGYGLSFTHNIAQGTAFGSAAAANAILMVFYLYNRDAPIMLFPIPIQIPVKWIVIGIAAIETAYLLLNHFHILFCIALLGLGAGYFWYLAFAGRKISLGVSEKFYGLKNSYYRWKRRRAARKFEVYMRKHDRTVTFDEHGNYVPPPDDNPKKNGGSKSGWVN